MPIFNFSDKYKFTYEFLQKKIEINFEDCISYIRQNQVTEEQNFSDNDQPDMMPHNKKCILIMERNMQIIEDIENARNQGINCQEFDTFIQKINSECICQQLQDESSLESEKD